MAVVRISHPPAIDEENPGDPGDLVAAYRYDGLGGRIARLLPNETNPENWDRTDYYFNEDWQVLEERSAAGQADPSAVAEETHIQYLPDIGGQTAPVLRWRDADDDPETGDGGMEETFYYVTDALGSVTALVSGDTGAAVELYRYDPYGQPVYGTPSLYENEVLYCGYLYNAESGLYQTLTRMYDPSLGRWISVDPAGYVDGSDLYQYVSSAPTSRTDPTGLAPDWEKFMQGLWESGAGEIDFLGSMSVGDAAPADAQGMASGYNTFLSGLLTMAEGLTDNPAYGELRDTLNSASGMINNGLMVVGAMRSFKGIAPSSLRVAPARPVQNLTGNRTGRVGAFDGLVSQAKQKYPKLAGKTHQHHIIPYYLGGAANGPRVPLNAAYHQQITNAFRKAHKYGQPPPDPTTPQRIMQDVYKQYPLPPGTGI